MRIALADASVVISTAHARHTASVLAAAPEAATFVLLGSTRKFTRWPDEHGDGVSAGEAAFLASGRNGVMLHPTMIYGAQGENNVQRIAALIRWCPVLPLPNRGRALIQPIHLDDVTRAILAAIHRTWDGAHSLIIAGPRPVPYADFVRAIAVAAGQRPPVVIGLPAGPLYLAAAIARRLPFLPPVQAAEIRRLTEDKAFDSGPMQRQLGFKPIPLQTGLARTFAARQGS